MNPYVDKKINEDNFVREFCEANEEEFIWHRDLRSRKITVLESDGWQFQYDNELPVKLLKDEKWYIEKNRYHRLIKGQGKLVLYIEEY